MYTGVLKERQRDGGLREIQTQCIAVGDGIDYVKYAENPVLDEMDVPEGGSRFDFRDPKMWKKKDGTYACVVGNRPADGSGQILLYVSEDGFHWHFKRVLISNEGRCGSVRTFFRWTESRSCWSAPRICCPRALNITMATGRSA